MSDYVVQLLRGEASTGNALARPVTPAAYSALLPTIWSLLNNEAGDSANAGAVLRVVVEHAMKAGSTSLVKRCTIDFLGRLALVSTLFASAHGITADGVHSLNARRSTSGCVESGAQPQTIACSVNG